MFVVCFDFGEDNFYENNSLMHYAFYVFLMCELFSFLDFIEFFGIIECEHLKVILVY